jgi:hypothetical protein
MDIFDLITPDEKQAIEGYINTCAEKELETSLETVLKPWAAAKSQFLLDNVFHGKLILEKPFVYEEVDTETTERLELDESAYIWDFVEAITQKSDFRILTEEIVTNRYSGKNVTLNLPSGKKYEIVKGTKVMRIFRILAEEYDVPGYEDFRIAVSQVLNQKTLKGHLCLSIHPLDYMTMSDNSSDWESCMSWIDSGCYRQGTVEMMNSPSVVVAYLRSDRDMTLPGAYTWNNKKWRELFIVTKNFITNVKSYPYYNANLTEGALRWLKELAGKDNYSDDEVSYGYGLTTIGAGWDEEADILFTTGIMYNDTRNTSHRQKGFFRKDLYKGFSYHYSGVCECMCCGKTDVDFDDEGDLVGTCCTKPYYCEYCGERINAGEAYSVGEDGSYYCEYCYENNSFYDDIAEISYPENECATLYLATPERDAYDATSYIYFNPNSSYNNYLENIYHGTDSSDYYIPYDECDSHILYLFGIDGWRDKTPKFNSARDPSYDRPLS